MLISLVIAYLNRKEQLLFTLKTIEKSKYKNIEVIIVDDGSRDDERLEDIVTNYRYNINLIRIDPSTKKHINPCIAYNIGFKAAKGDIVIIQNPECCHIEDIVSYVADNLKLGDYISFACYGLDNIAENSKVHDMYKDDIEDSCKTITQYILNKGRRIGGNGTVRDTVGGWLNSGFHFTAYHYCSAIYRSDLDKLGGFDEDYAYGICRDDDDFIRRIEKQGFVIKYPDITQFRPFVIHQWHKKTESIVVDTRKSFVRNATIFSTKMKNLGISDQMGVFPTPIII